MLLNGTPRLSFRCSKGLRQGDPFSPLLFILCIDVLYRMLNQVIHQGMLPSVGVGSVRVHTLQFADDLLLFFDGKERSGRVIKAVLEGFAAASGLIINYSKSVILPVNLPATQVAALADLFGCPVGSFPITYLGFPISPRALRKADFLPLIEKLDKRLAGWKGQLLSRAGHLVLLNSVLSSIPAFYCSAFRILCWVIKEIDKIRRGFLWKGGQLNNGFHYLVNWEQVSRPRDRGGLGIRKLKAANSSLLMKNLWSFHNDDSLPWARLLRALHYKRRSPFVAGTTPPRCSPLWKGILSISSPFLASVSFTLGDGKKASFWHARWASDTLLSYRFPALFSASTCTFLTIDDWLRRFGSKRDFGFHANCQERSREIASLNCLISTLQRSSRPDEIRWRWNRKGNFSVRSAYGFLVFDGLDDRKIKHLWGIRMPSNLKIFIWLASRNKILTADRLRSKGWIGPFMCSLCGNDSECLEHLLFRCTFAKEVWNWVMRDEPALLRGLLDEEGDLATRWIRARLLLKGRRKQLLDMCIAATCWRLWLERNQRIFADRVGRSTDCGARIVETIERWFEARGAITT